jgi:hypothetical protein
MTDAEISEEDILKVPFDIVDLTPPECRQLGEPGFYYSIPMDESEKVHPSELFLAGPFETHEAAIDAARDFIRDALKDHSDADA